MPNNVIIRRLPNTELLACYIPDSINGGYTAYIVKQPEVIAEGNSIEETETTLIENLKTVMELAA